MEPVTGRETASGRAARPTSERHSPVTGGRASPGSFSPAYLACKGGTEDE
ncbi:hypothetical protein ACFY4C_18020 [Actinomadura viridis]